MAEAAVVFILYVVSMGNLPDFTALGAYASRDACTTAAKTVTDALSSSQYPKTALCLSSDSLNQLAKSNDVSQQ